MMLNIKRVHSLYYNNDRCFCFLVKGFERTGTEERNRWLHGKIRTGLDDQHEVQTSERRDEEKTVSGHSVNRQIEGSYTSCGELSGSRPFTIYQT